MISTKKLHHSPSSTMVEVIFGVVKIKLLHSEQGDAKKGAPLLSPEKFFSNL